MNEISSSLHLDVTALRLVVALVLAGVIGWERERLRKPAGFRTHILVGVGSALIMMVSLFMVDLAHGAQNVDPGRIAAQVVVGIGFLGAGTILRSQEGIVSGLTTAASLWVVSGIGLAAGCGFFSGAVLTTVIVLVVLFFMNWVDEYVQTHLYHSVTVHIKMKAQLVENIKEVLRDLNVRIVRTEVQAVVPSEKFVVVHFKPIPVAEGKIITHRLLRISGIKEVVFE